MERVPQLVRRGKKDRRMGAPSELDWEAIEALRTEMRVELIQELIPLGMAEVGRVLDEEVERLAGPRHARKGEGEVIYRPWEQPGLGTPGRAASSGPGQALGCEVWRERRVWSRTSACTGRRARWTRGCSARSCLGSRVVTTRPRWRQCRGRSGCRSRRCRGSSRRRPPGRRLLGYRHLPSLRAAIQKELGIIHPDSQTHAAA